MTLRAQKKAETHRALADAAKACFAKKGFDATTMADVARAVGVSEQTVYNYFPTKESLVFDQDERIRAEIVAFADDPRGLIAATRDFCYALIDRIRSFDGDLEGGMVALIATHPRLRGELLVRMQNTAQGLTTALVKTSKAPSAVARTRAAAVVAVITMLIEDVSNDYVTSRPRKQSLSGAKKAVDQALETLGRGIE